MERGIFLVKVFKFQRKMFSFISLASKVIQYGKSPKHHDPLFSIDYENSSLFV